MKRIAYISNGYITNVSLAPDDYVLPSDGSEMLEADALAMGLSWPPPPPPPDYKIWSNAQAFMAEFSMPEKAQIALSTDPTIAALRLELSTWFSEVYANDPRVVTGLDKLVELGIITEARKQEIIAMD